MNNQLFQKAMLYKMVFLMLVLFSINALASAIMLSFLNVDWSQLSPTSKFLIWVAVLQNWTGTLLAFFNKSISRVEQGRFPIDTGDTNPQAFVRTTTETTVKPNP